MKKLFFILFLVCFQYVICKAQTPIIDIYNQGLDIKGAYNKDINHYLDPFSGTWIYTNGTTSLKFVLKKATMTYDGYAYYDLLYGEYQYIENGAEKLNTLSEINTIHPYMGNHNISGNHIYFKDDNPKCIECLPNEIRVVLRLSDNVKQITHRITARVKSELGPNSRPILSMHIWSGGITYPNNTGNLLEDFSHTTQVGVTIPSGNYELEKQP